MTARSCPVNDCGRSIRARGMCSMHYKRAMKGQDPQVDPPRFGGIRQRNLCSVDECEADACAQGLCRKHWRRIRRNGKTSLPTNRDRFEAKIDRAGPGGCWLWMAGVADTGYGTFKPVGSPSISAHRYSYELYVGAIPAGLTIDHLCRVRACVNPSHLEPVPLAENIRRAQRIGYGPAAPKTCKRGHDWSVVPPIIAHRSSGKVSRRCRQCDTELRQRRAAS